jgi:exopolysaccharide biosynthesis protein
VSTNVKRSLILYFALVIGSLVALFQHMPYYDIHAQQLALPLDGVDEELLTSTVVGLEQEISEIQETSLLAEGNIVSIRGILAELTEKAQTERELYDSQVQELETVTRISAAEREKSFDLLDQILANMLGDPIGQTFGERATIKVFSLQEAGYRGYMAKVRLHDPSAVRLVLAGDSVGNRGETTSQAAKRTGATLAINAGGYARGDDGNLYPIGITVVDGEIKTFYRTDLSFIGFNRQGRLVGGDLTTREEIENLDVLHGATFVPTLLKNGEKMPIPGEWRNARHPRTLVGHFSNGDVLFVVIDGRQRGYSNGVTLEEAQDKLLEFNVVDAYNLDGGGSSVFYYNGRVLNSPSDGRERALPTNFVITP